MDPYAELVKYLTTIETIKSVHVELPHDAELRVMPCINLVSAGRAQRQPSMQGLGIDIQDIDVDVYVDDLTWKKGDAFRIANLVRLRLTGFRVGMMRAVEVSRPDKLPDRNANIRRLGMTVSVLLPAPK